jgi:chromosome segregation ATPase
MAIEMTPELWGALIIAVAGLITAVAVFIRGEGIARAQKTEIALIRTQGAEKEKEHTRKMQVFEKQVELEREKQANVTEIKLLEVIEARGRDWEARATAMTARVDELEKTLNETNAARVRLERALDVERGLREKLEEDFENLKRRFESVQAEKRAVERERDDLLQKNRDLTARLDKISGELDDTRKALADLERKFQAYEDKHNGGDDDPTPPGEKQPVDQRAAGVDAISTQRVEDDVQEGKKAA